MKEREREREKERERERKREREREIIHEDCFDSFKFLCFFW